jgi:hypothetical protein
MARTFSLCMTAIVGVLVGCSDAGRTVVLDWTNAPPSSDSVAAAFAKVLRDGPDSLQKCSNKRVRLAFVNHPGAFSISSKSEGNTTIQYGPSTFVERNLVRSIAYASADQLATFGIDTLVVTLTRSSRDAGQQRASYEIIHSELALGSDVFASYSAPVTPVSLVEQPCASTRR